MKGNYYFIENILNDFVAYNKRVQKSYLSFNDQRSLDLENEKYHPVLYSVIRSVNRLENVLDFNMRIYCLDNLFADRSNEKDVMNETLEILNDLYNFLSYSKKN